MVIGRLASLSDSGPNVLSGKEKEPRLRYCYEKSADMAYIGAKTRDVGRLAYGNMGRKNPGPRELINKAAYTEPVLQDLLIGSLIARGLKGT